MYIFYLIALIPAIIGAILFMVRDEIDWREWLGGTAAAFAVSGILHLCAFCGMTADKETWSGRITHVIHNPAWTEFYTETHTRTVGSGKNQRTETYTDSHTQYHPEHWDAYAEYGECTDDRNVDQSLFNEIKQRFGNTINKTDTQSSYHGGHCISGNRNCYITVNNTGYVYPVTTTKRFINRVKAAPSVFSFAKVPTNVPVYNWPENPNWMSSDRLIGLATKLDHREWDLMNTKLGSSKYVNVIIIGFDKSDPMLGKWQEAKWIGGKKNDVVLCYGIEGTNIVWSYVFGWTEQNICKRNLETMLLSNPIDNSIIPLIQKEIELNYVIKDWSKFDYITIEPPLWSYIVLIVLMILTQCGLWYWFYINGHNKNI